MFRPNSTIGWPINHLQRVARDLLAFLRAPTVHPQHIARANKASELAWLFALNCIIVAIIAAMLFPLMFAFGVEMSGDMAEMFKRPIWQLMLFVVVVGPIMEELMFRTWISGQPRLLVLVGGLLAWIGGSYALAEFGLADSSSVAVPILIAIIAASVLAGLIRFWKRPVPRWYTGIFPAIFWGQALLFGFIHVFNYAGDNPFALLPFVLPQLVGGLIWGYARIRFGWWSSIAMHMAYNLIATSGLIYMLLTRPEVL